MSLAAEPVPPVTYGYATSGSGIVCLFVVAALVAVAIWLLLRRSSRRPGHHPGPPSPIEHTDPADPYAATTTEQLEAEANTRLVAADDALKTSEQELTFATAQYGAGATHEFEAALAAARADVDEAFRLKQLLDDEIPDDEPTRRQWFAQIIERCRAAGDRLDAQVEAFDKLRDLEAHLDTLIPALTERRQATTDRLPSIANTYASLQQRYADSALLPISNSATQATERIAFVDRTLGQARDALAEGQRPTAAVAVRAAEEGVGQIELILDGVQKMAASLDTATTSVRDLLADVESDVAAGHAAVNASTAGSPGTIDLAAAVAGAEQVTMSVRMELAAPRPDPFHLLTRLEQVNIRIDRALANIRDAATRAERARTSLERAIPAARAKISAVTDFITTRRGAVGSQARTRIAEAQRNLDQAVALSGTDPVAALSAAEQALNMADRAGNLAHSDVDGWSEPDVIVGGTMGGLGGAVLGGILLDSVLGGGRRGGLGGGGFGAGLPGGFSGGGFGGAFGWGGRRAASFGGQRTRVRLRS